MIKTPNTFEEYRKHRNDYEELAKRVNHILFEILELEQINFALTENRAKSIESFQTKIENYNNNKQEFYDLAGIRVVGYVRMDVEKIVKIIKKNFDVDEKKSKDKSSELKPNQFGYRAIHLVGKLPSERVILPEYKKFKGMFFEIQVKTILEHAWAQIEHDKNYKYKALPDNLKRELYLISGNLEMSDKHFDDITKKIEDYDKTVQEKTEHGKLEEIEINPATLKRYLLDKFAKQIELIPRYGFDGDGKEEVREILDMGITNLSELDKIIPKNLVNVEKKFRKKYEKSKPSKLTGLVFSILIQVFAEKSFESLSRKRYMSKETFNEYLEKYEKLLNKS